MPPPACPACGLRLQPGAAVCVACGYHLAKGRRLRTSVEQLRERGRAKKQKRREAGAAARLGPWIIGLLTAVALLVVFAWGQSGSSEAVEAFRALRLAAAVGGLIVIGYAVSQAGLLPLIYPRMAWVVLLGDDANPFVVGAFINSGLAATLAVLLIAAPAP